jgi:hypothetical protein
LLGKGNAVHRVAVCAEDATDRMDLVVVIQDIILHPAELGPGVNLEAVALCGSAENCCVIPETCRACLIDELTERDEVAHGSCLWSSSR